MGTIHNKSNNYASLSEIDIQIPNSIDSQNVKRSYKSHPLHLTSNILPNLNRPIKLARNPPPYKLPLKKINLDITKMGKEEKKAIKELEKKWYDYIKYKKKDPNQAWTTIKTNALLQSIKNYLPYINNNINSINILLKNTNLKLEYIENGDLLIIKS